MKVAEAAKELKGTVMTGAADNEVLGAYSSDLLSDVMANSREGDLWITLQKHVNIVAVAQLNGISAIALVNNRTPEPDTLARAEEMRVAIISTPLQAFDAAGVLYARGIRGRRQI